MSRVLSDLLGASEPMFTRRLRQLEAASGTPGADIKLTSDIARKVHVKQKALGLDPRDTTPEELYHALQALVKLHDGFLGKAIGVSDDSSSEEAIAKIIKTVDKLPLNKTCWAIKSASAKRLIKATPPKKVMKQLGYKSVDSMLKRESIADIYAAVRILETPTWLDHFILTYKQLKPNDFESRPVKIVNFTTKRWETMPRHFMYNQRRSITHLKEMGVIVVLPLPVEHLQGICITMLALLLYYINELRVYSALFKLHQVKPDFADMLVTTLRKDPGNVVDLNGQAIHWRVLQRHYGRLKKSQHPSAFEPYVQPDDLYWHEAEAALYRLEPALKFWEGLDYVGVTTKDQPVSLNLIDNVLNYCNNLSYKRRSVQHMRGALWDELWVRYIQQSSLEQAVMQQLDKDSSPLELAEAFDLETV